MAETIYERWAKDEGFGTPPPEGSRVLARFAGRVRADEGFEEELHPRDKRGKFRKKGAGSGGLPELPWEDPPPPLGKGGQGKAGGYSSDKAFGTNTTLGRIGEKSFVDLLGGSILHPEGKGEQSPLDVRCGNYGVEVKGVARKSTAYKATPKPYEIEQKEAYAKELKVKPALSIVVMDHDAKVAYVYWRDGLKTGRLSKNTGWKFAGKTDLPEGGNAAMLFALAADTQFEKLHPRGPKGWFAPKGGVLFGKGERFEDRLDFKEGLSGPEQFKVERAMYGVSDAVAKVHRWPGEDEGQPFATAEIIGDPHLNGQFHRGGYPEPPGDIYRLGSQADHPIVNMIHETGHALDFGALGTKYGKQQQNGVGSDRAFELAAFRLKGDPVFPEPPDAFEKVALAIQKSDTWKELDRQANGKVHAQQGQTFAEYMQQPTEAFARAYEQYIVNHADNPDITAEEQGERLIRETGGMKVWYWPDDDFEPIDEAMTDLFKDMGLDKPKPKPGKQGVLFAVSADTEFEKLHPRGRKGEFIRKGVSAPRSPLKFGNEPMFADTIKAEGTLPESRLQVEQVVEQASLAVAKVHHWPGPDEGQPEARAELMVSPKLAAQFQKGGPPVIFGKDPPKQDTYRISRDTDEPAMSLIHEMGHGLDYESLGEEYGIDFDYNRKDILGGAMTASNQAFRRAQEQIIDPRPENQRFGWNAMADLAFAIQKSDTWTRLEKRELDAEAGSHDEAMYQYMRQPTETFARAYEQWIAKHNADDYLIARMFEDERRARNDPGDWGKDVWYWDDEDFKPIDEAMTKMMEDLKWDQPSAQE